MNLLTMQEHHATSVIGKKATLFFLFMDPGKSPFLFCWS